MSQLVADSFAQHAHLHTTPPRIHATHSWAAIGMVDVREVQRRTLVDCVGNCDPLLSQMAQVAGSGLCVVVVIVQLMAVHRGYWLHLMIGVDAALGTE